MRTLTEQVIAQLGTIVVVLDEHGQAEYVSPSALAVLGFHPEDLLGEGWFALTRTEDAERKRVKEHLEMIRQGKNPPAPYERLLQTAFGRHKWILWNTCSADGKLIGIGYDITERKRQEELLAKRTNDLDERNREMESSLRYAQRIQEAILPSVEELRHSFNGAFVYYKPKDIVSGDFWWHYEKENIVYVAAIDCTGHGVPGALMSVLAHSVFREVFINKALDDPAEILHAIDKELFAALNKEHGHQPYPDGMDVALCRFDKRTYELRFAGAYRPLMLVRNGEITEYRACRYPIGFYNDAVKQFTTMQIGLQEGDMVYLFSDGYADQFGGEKKKKLNKGRFRELLCTISTMNMEEQESFLEYALVNWKQEEPQTDDILVIGLQA